MSVLNRYTPAPALEQKLWHIDTAAHEYDLNFVLPVPSSLTASGVKLVPYTPSLHSKIYDHFASHPSMFRYLGYQPTSMEYWLTYVEKNFRRQAEVLIFAIFDQSLTFEGDTVADDDERRLAGIIGVINTSAEQRRAEIGQVLVLPPFHRSHVTTQSIGLLLKWLFDEIKLRRVQWNALYINEESVNAALRIGFRKEGVLRWERLMPLGKELGEKVPEWAEETESKPGRGWGRHSALLAIGWDDWRDGVSEQVNTRMQRTVEKRSVESLNS